MNGDYSKWKRDVTDAALGKLKKKYIPPGDALHEKVHRVIETAKLVITPVIKAGGAVKTQDREQGLKPMLLGCLLQQFDSFTKEELQQFLSLMVADAMIADIESNPYGSSTPDLLGGV